MRPALNDRQIARMVFRIALFRRRGLTEDQAEKLADRLADRDHDQDDRRDCLECSHLRGMNCAVSGAVLRGLLQRCPTFSWELPNQ
jgi:hypothetical protein